MILLIVNPVAGKLRANTALADIIKVYSNLDIDVNVRFTCRRGQATELAKAAKAAMYDRIVCVGGDGTLNEVITGIIQSGENIPLGYVPLGSTNDFANSVGLPRDVEEAAELSVEGDPIALDIGSFNDEHNFAYIASFGMFTAASYSATQGTKNALGHFAYILEGIKDIVNIKSTHLSVTADSASFEDEYIFGAIANSTSIGGIVRLDSSFVDMSDGLFEMLLIKNVRTPNDLNLLITSIMNSDFDNKMFDFARASEITVSCDTPMKWSLDGEEADSDGLTVIKNLHNAIQIYH